MPLVWASRRSGTPLPRRIAGVDLMLEASRLAAERGYTIFLLGGTAGVATQTAETLRERFPGLNATGTHAPSPLPMSPEDEGSVLDMIRTLKPDMLFVAFGAPLQERWVRRHMEALGVPICAGVGGAFDMISGRVPRAPEWMQRNGLEWFYRFVREPRRLWKRYFVRDLPMFVRLMVHSSTRTTAVSVTEIGTSDLGASVIPQAGTLSAHE
jgi:N-acetylglucosaminyldiphosphoundecaprenol N-acetyl-beta-D-mannosaminyltransferase